MEQNDEKELSKKQKIWVYIISLFIVGVLTSIFLLAGKPIVGPVYCGVLAPLLFVVAFIALCLYIVKFYKLWKHGKLNWSRFRHYAWYSFIAIFACWHFYDKMIKGFEFWKELIINHVNIFAQ